MKKSQIQKIARLAVVSIGELSYANIKAWIKQTYGYDVTQGEIKASASAFTDHKERFMAVSSKVGEPFAVRLLLHELGHLVLQHSPIFPGDKMKAENEAEYFVKCALRYAALNKCLKPAAVSAAVLLCCGLSAVLGTACKKGGVGI